MQDSTTRDKLVLPFLGPIYRLLSGPAETLLRVVCGIALVVHGTPKILDPFGAAGMVESIGFWPGWLWSVLLSIGEFGSGVLLVVGFLTRPAAVVATIILLVTVYFHGIQLEQGWAGAEKSVLWAAVTFFFAVNGARTISVDRILGRHF
jgi:putative oxidoreductase